MKYEKESLNAGGTVPPAGINVGSGDPETPCPEKPQAHVHEFLGSVKLAELGTEDVHNHRFAGVSDEAVMVPGGHVHKLFTRTDFFDHFHFIDQFTLLPIPVGEGKHVHFASGVTTVRDDHCHEFQVATLLDAPLLPETTT